MHKSDLFYVQGNTMRPLILAVDDKQLLPTVIEDPNQNAENIHTNRFH